MIRRTQRRAGVTLIEVLIAIFILSVGMLAIMALFPIGAVSMARAINQTRSADHAAASDAMFRYYWKRAWIDTNGGGVRGSSGEAFLASGEPMVLCLDRSPTNPAVALIDPTSSQPSFPLMVDPIGSRTQLGATNAWVAGLAPATVPPNALPVMPARVSLFAAINDPLLRTTVRLTTLMDDMSYDGNGEPSTPANQIERGGRYNVSWLIQRPRNNVPQEVHQYVMVFAGRSPTDSPSTEDAITNAYTTGYYAGIDPKPNAIVLPLTNGAVTRSKPAVRKGGWVAFSVACTPSGGTPYPTFDFYRISAVDDTSSPGNVILEFEEPLRTYDTSTLLGDGTYAAAYIPASGTLYGTVVVFDNLVEVFDRGIVSASSISGR